MPPLLPAALLKSLVHLRPALSVYARPRAGLVRPHVPDSTANITAHARSNAGIDIITSVSWREGSGVRGGARFAGRGWYMAKRAVRAPEGGRKHVRSGADRGGGWSGKEKAGGGAMGSLQYQNEDGVMESNDRYKRQQSSTKLLTLPTVLTLGRVTAVPLLVTTFYMDGWWSTTATTSIFIAAAVTDWLDGYIARKMRLGTAFGAFLDPVADKLMVATTLVLLCSRPLEVAMLGEVPWLLAVPSITIIGREITMSAIREWAASQNSGVLEAVAVNNLGRWKTATQMTSLTILLATRDPSLTGLSAVVASGVLLLYISAGLAIWSLIVYMRKIWRILLK